MRPPPHNCIIVGIPPTLIYELIEPTLIVDALYCHSMIIFVFFD